MKTFYLENTGGGHNKFYRGVQSGRFLMVHYGAIGTEGQTRLWAYSHPHQAERAFLEKLEAKRNKGYVDIEDPRSMAELQQMLEEALRNRPYELFWQVEAQPLPPALIEQAAAEADRVLVEIGRPGATAVRFVPERSHGHAVCEAEDSRAHFGYPSNAWITKLKEEGAVFDLERLPSRDGWLSMQGTGQGVIETAYGMLDLPVRLFLCRLIVLAAQSGLTVQAQDTFGVILDGSVPLPPNAEDLCWHSHFEVLRQVMAARGWLPGVVQALETGMRFDVGGQEVTFDPIW